MMYHQAIHLFAMFEEGIASKDELTLVEAVDKWEQWDNHSSGDRISGSKEMPGRSVFESLSKAARAALLPSQQAFSTFLKTTQSKLHEGMLLLHTSGTSSAHGSNSIGMESKFRSPGVDSGGGQL